MFKKFAKYLALDKKIFTKIWLKLFNLTNEDYIDYLLKVKKVYSIGKECHINRDVNITNPMYVRIGNNVCLSSCTLIGHDAVVSVLNRAYDMKLDSVGKIDIKDNVFIGMGAIILQDCTIGPNSVVAAGAVVTRDVPPGKIVGGIPAKIIGETENLAYKLQEETKTLPWYDLIKNRVGAYDPVIEPELIRRRVKYFFTDASSETDNSET